MMNSKKENARSIFFPPQWAVQTLTQRENVVMSEVKHDWKPTYWSYADVVSWGQMVGKRLIIAEWFALIRSETLHWGQLHWGQNGDQFRDQTISFPTGKPVPLMKPLRKCFSFSILQSPFNFLTSRLLLLQTSPLLSLSSFLSFSHSPLCVASHASSCWIIDGMLSWWDFSCCGLVCWSGFVLLSFCCHAASVCVECKYTFAFG